MSYLALDCTKCHAGSIRPELSIHIVIDDVPSHLLLYANVPRRDWTRR